MPSKKVTLEEAIDAVKKAVDPLDLVLINAGIGKEGAWQLAEAIKVTQVPINLNLSINHIGDVGTVFFAEAIKRLQVPLNLNLGGNHIGHDYAQSNIGMLVFLDGYMNPQLSHCILKALIVFYEKCVMIECEANSIVNA